MQTNINQTNSNGEKEGPWVYYLGSLRYEGCFVEGKKEGLWKSYFSIAGIVICDAEFKNGVLHGRRRHYYRTGEIRDIGDYVNGKKFGLWIKYTPYNKIIRQEFYAT